MKYLKSFLTAFLLMIGMQASAEELYLSVPKNVQAGQEFVLSIAFENEQTNYCAFLMDIQVSDAISFVQELNEDGKLTCAVTLNADRKQSDHQLSWNLIGSNTLRIVCFSSTNKTFKDNSGEIVSLKLKMADQAEAIASVCIKNPYFTNTDEEDVYLDECCQELTDKVADAVDFGLSV